MGEGGCTGLRPFVEGEEGGGLGSQSFGGEDGEQEVLVQVGNEVVEGVELWVFGGGENGDDGLEELRFGQWTGCGCGDVHVLSSETL